MPEKAIEKNKNTKRGLKVAAIAGGLVLVGGVAFAFWTQSGSGVGSARTANTTGITVNQTGDPVSGLGPGVAALPLGGDFTNNNTSTVHVSSVTVTIASIT